MADIDFSKLSEEELDAIIDGQDPAGAASGAPFVPSAGAGAPVPGMPGWEQTYTAAPRPQPTLREILQQAGTGMGGKLLTYYKGMFGSPEERAQHGQIMAQMREELPFSDIGEFGADAAVSLPFPLAKGTALVRAGKTGVMQAPVGALAARGEGGDDLEVAKGALAGFGGGVFGSTVADAVTKAINATRGKWSDPVKKHIFDYNRGRLKAGESGVDLSVGDLFPESMIRKFEDVGEMHPILSHRADRVNLQARQVGDMLTGPNGNVFKNAVDATRQIIDEQNQHLWEPLYTAASQVKGIQPFDTRKALWGLSQSTLQYLASHSNEATRAVYAKLLAAKRNQIPPTLTMREIRDIQQSAGPLTRGPALDQAAKTAQAELKSLFKGTKTDLQNWGADPTTKPIYELYNQVNEEYKKSFLPFYQNSLVLRSKDGKYDQKPEKMISDLLAGSNQTQREQLLWYISNASRTPNSIGSHLNFAARDGTGLIETIKAADRGARRFTQNPNKTNRTPGSLFSALTVPVSSSSRAPGFMQYYGASHEIGPRAMQAGLRGGLAQNSRALIDRMMPRMEGDEDE